MLVERLQNEFIRPTETQKKHKTGIGLAAETKIEIFIWERCHYNSPSTGIFTTSRQLLWFHDFREPKPWADTKKFQFFVFQYISDS